jgi:flagellar biosynthesis/type III secretory pathway M-ring protein FliF/YscJ
MKILNLKRNSKDYKIKISGGKLKISTQDSVINIDLDNYPLIETTIKQSTIGIFKEDKKILATVSFETVEDAKEANAILTKILMKKNKKFKSVKFVGKVFLWILIVYILIRLLIGVAIYQQTAKYNQQVKLMKQQEILSEIEQEKKLETTQNIDKALGQSVPVDEIFK